MSGIELFDILVGTATGVVKAVFPLLAILAIFQAIFLKLPTSYFVNLLKGTSLSALGLWIFLVGVQIGFLPYGQAIGEAFSGFSQNWGAILFGFVLGFITTWSEPAVRVLCDQVEDASAGSIHKRTILYAICIGVAFAVMLGVARVAYNIPFLYIVLPGYILALVMLWFTQKEFVGIAFDAGGVATGPIANTFILGLGLGFAAANGDSLIVSGLGLIALIALAPILSVLLLGIFIRARLRKETKEVIDHV